MLSTHHVYINPINFLTFIKMRVKGAKNLAPQSEVVHQENYAVSISQYFR